MFYPNRLKRARALMREKNVDLLVLTHSTDLFYLTGARGHMMERLACLLLTQNDAHFVAPGFELGNLSEESHSLLTCHGWSDGENPFALVKKHAGKPGMAAVGRETPSWVLLELMGLIPGCGWQSADELLIELRILKDDHEFQLMKRVQEKACDGLAGVIRHGICGMTELQVYKLLRDQCAEAGVDLLGGIVGSGPNSALPHHHSGDRVIEKGDVVCIDFVGEEPGVGYKADTTRTYCVGYIPDGFREIYDTVNKANQAAFEAARPGTPCEDVDKAARAVITNAGYGDYFTHRTGHGLGLDIHEHPYISSGNRDLIRVGYAFSDEPGIYLPGRYGVRIEDQIFISSNGPVRMTPTDSLLSHELIVCE